MTGSDEARVWYASYGSNLLAQRLSCYLAGGRLEGMAAPCAGARDPTPPRATAALRAPFALLFAGQSERWGGGGRAFIVPRVPGAAAAGAVAVSRAPGAAAASAGDAGAPCAAAGADADAPCADADVAWLRLYDLSLAQFHDVVAQENGLPVPLPAALQLTAARLAALRRDGSVDLLPTGPYRRLLYLGEHAGLPVLTFTCSEEDVARIARGDAGWRATPPSAAYRATIHHGLEELGLAPPAAEAIIASAAAAGAAPAAAAVAAYAGLPQGFIDVRALVPDLLLDMRYLTAHNFMGRPVPGYRAPRPILTLAAARALAAVAESARAHGMALKVYDAYRPQRAVDAFHAWSEDPRDLAMRAEFYPDLDKPRLFTDGYIARRSSHSRGSTVDLTLVQLPAAPQPEWRPGTPLVDGGAPHHERYADNGIDMGTGFDYFGPRSHTDSAAIAPQHRRNRDLLRSMMQAAGFENLATEWWHYTLAHEPFPDTYFDFEVQ